MLTSCGTRAILGARDGGTSKDPSEFDVADGFIVNDADIDVVNDNNDATSDGNYDKPDAVDSSRDGATSDGGVAMCAPERTACGSACVDVSTDPRNCGACGVACAAGQVCDLGRCVMACEGTRNACDGSCVNLATNAAHCGACRRACRNDQRCIAGACQCPVGLVDCGGFCSDTRSDTNHCGACGNACPRPRVCATSVCVCPEGLSACGAQCVDYTNNASNCGGCGVRCASGEDCVDSRCE